MTNFFTIALVFVILSGLYKPFFTLLVFLITIYTIKIMVFVCCFFFWVVQTYLQINLWHVLRFVKWYWIKIHIDCQFCNKIKFWNVFLGLQERKGCESSKVALKQTHKRKFKVKPKCINQQKKIVNANWDQNHAQPSCKVIFQFTRHTTSQTWELCATFLFIIYFMIDGWGCVKVTKKLKTPKK